MAKSKCVKSTYSSNRKCKQKPFKSGRMSVTFLKLLLLLVWNRNEKGKRMNQITSHSNGEFEAKRLITKCINIEKEQQKKNSQRLFTIWK